uniref:Glycosyltransferase RgtA/B/C/D-like domain-containing protein n=1 Tax=candidate division WOR-3 bacterium TaxID=2052148 RepID=A0A7V4E439_UNCW3
MRKEKAKKIIVNEKKIILILFLIFLLLAFLAYDPKPALGGDNIHYLLLAQSLISFKGYKDLWHPQEKPHTQYPFGFPLLIIPFLLIFGKDSLFLNILPLIFFILSFFLVYKIFEKWKFKYLLLSLFFFSPLVVENSHVLLSEPPFIFFSLLTLFFFLRWEETKKIKYFLFSSSSATFAFFIRTAGISLVLALLIYFLIKKRYLYLLILFLIFFLPFFAWQERNRKIANEVSYLAQFLQKNPYQPELGNINFSEYLARFLKNFYLYNFLIMPKICYFKESPPPIWQFFIGILTIIFIIMGSYFLIKKKTSLNLFIFLYFLLSSLIILSWPEVWTSERFLFPFLIFLFYITIIGGEKIFYKLKINFLAYLFLSFLFLFYLIKNLQIIKENLPNTIKNFSGDKYAGYPIDWQNYFKVLKWAKDNLPQEAIIVSRKPEFTYFISQRKSVLYLFSTEPQKVLKKMIADKADYLLYDNFYWTLTSQKYLLPVLKIYPEYFELVYQTPPPKMELFKIKKN